MIDRMPYAYALFQRIPLGQFSLMAEAYVRGRWATDLIFAHPYVLIIVALVFFAGAPYGKK